MDAVKICYSLFSGCGGSDSGMVQAGYTAIGGVEYHQPASDIYNLNHVNPVTVANILDVDSIPTVDLLWVSPPCPNFSQANPDRGETDFDIKLANHIAHLVTTSRPRSIAIENVRGYSTSQSLSLIWAALENAWYKVEDSTLNAANYGTPSTRLRYIVRASLDKIGAVAQTHQSPRRYTGEQLSLFPESILPNWISWWDVIADRIGELPRSELTDNQKTSATLAGIKQALLIERVGYYNLPNIYFKSSPSPTIRAHTSVDDKGTYRVSHNIWDGLDCYSADIRCLAAWQGFPQDYQWGENRGQAGRAIGNAVPPPLAKAVALSLY